jgi:hypothetical protein
MESIDAETRTPPPIAKPKPLDACREPAVFRRPLPSDCAQLLAASESRSALQGIETFAHLGAKSEPS